MKIKVSATKQCVSVYAVEGVLPIASAECSNMEYCWYVNRVVVIEGRSDKVKRGQGLGSKLLQRMISEALKLIDQNIVVDPGGYGADPERQINFYKKNGFVESDIPGRLIYGKR